MLTGRGNNKKCNTMILHVKKTLQKQRNVIKRSAEARLLTKTVSAQIYLL